MMINKSFKLTTIAAALAAVTACGGSSSSSGGDAAKPLNEKIESQAFNIESYQGITEADDIYGTWLVVSKSSGSGASRAADLFSGDNAEAEYSGEAAMLRAVGVVEGPMDDTIVVTSACGAGSGFGGGNGGGNGLGGPVYYKVAENTYERGGDYSEEDGYVSAYNEDGTCADDSNFCEKETLVFASNVSGSSSSAEQWNDDGSTWVQNDEGDIDSGFDDDLFEYFDIPEGSEIEVVFEDSGTAASEGAMIKLGNTSKIEFNQDALSYSGLLDNADAESTFDGADTVNCFEYESEGDKYVLTTNIVGEEEAIVSTYLESDDDLMLASADTEFHYEQSMESLEETGYSFVSERLWLDTNEINVYFSNYVEGIAGITSTESNDVFSIADVSIENGTLSVSGSVVDGAEWSDEHEELTINFSVDVNAATEVEEVVLF